MDAYRIEDCMAQASTGMTRGKPVRVDDGCSIEVSVVPGRFDAWLERFWVRLFVPSARPTTASL